MASPAKAKLAKVVEPEPEASSSESSESSEDEVLVFDFTCWTTEMKVLGNQIVECVAL